MFDFDRTERSSPCNSEAWPTFASASWTFPDHFIGPPRIGPRFPIPTISFHIDDRDRPVGDDGQAVAVDLEQVQTSSPERNDSESVPRQKRQSGWRKFRHPRHEDRPLRTRSVDVELAGVRKVKRPHIQQNHID
jgi:hypothetical protein